MTFQATKFLIPPPRGSLLPREALLTRLQAQTPLTLLNAPPGYGKTNLLATWAAKQTHAAWLALDIEDNTHAQFWESLLTVLHPILAVQPFTIQPTDLPTLLSALQTTPPLALFLENYHHIQSPDIHQTITFLVDHLPSNVRLFITTHLPPPLPLSRWRARGQMTEFSPDDLRVPVNELPLHPDFPPAYLENRSQGWPAGIQIALNLPPNSSLTGAHPHFVDYFTTELIPLLTPSAQEYLLRTSILEILTPALCETLTSDLHLKAEPILKNTPFVFPADTHGGYQIHPLFRDYLQDQLSRRLPQLTQELHRRAWQALAQIPTKALPHALAANDFQTAANFLADIAPHLLQTGQWPELRTWLDQLPDENVWSNPRLCLSRVWLTLETYQQTALQPYLDRLDSFLTDHPPHKEMLAEIYAVRAIVAAMRHAPDRALAFARQAETHWGNGDPLTGAYVAFALGAAFKMSLDSPRAEHWFRQTLALAEASRNAYLTFSAHENLSDMLYLQARLSEAQIHGLRAIKFATVEGREAPFTGWVRCVLGLIAFAWNELDTAQTEAERSIEICKQWENVAMQLRGWLLLAQIYQTRGEYAQALHALEIADTLARQTGETRLTQLVVRHRVLLALSERNLDAARRWWGSVEAPSPDMETDPIPNLHHFITAARLRLAEGQPRYAIEQLNKDSPEFQRSRMSLYEIEWYILSALAYRGLGKPDQAMGTLQTALHLAAPSKIQHLFLQAGAPMRELLRRAAIQSPHASFIGLLLAKFGGHSAEETGHLTLTAREVQILRLLAAGFSNRDMAEELVIAESTLKRHIANLYLKMDVHSRTQALARANEFHLL